MATLPENINKIRRTAIYGTEIREAIASAIEQSDTQVDNRIASIRRDIETNSVYMTVSKISGSDEDYLLEVSNHL